MKKSIKEISLHTFFIAGLILLVVGGPAHNSARSVRVSQKLDICVSYVIILDNGIDGDEEAGDTETASPGWCKPDAEATLKIPPEPPAERCSRLQNRLSGAGVASRYPGAMVMAVGRVALCE